MQTRLIDALGLKLEPVAVLLSNNRPAGALQFKEAYSGCVGAMMLAASKGRTAVFDRKTFGCPGGGVGLGFGDYGIFPIEKLLSTGGKADLGNGRTYDMGEGERFHASPELSHKWVQSIPLRQVPTEYVVFKPLTQCSEQDSPVLVLFLVNPDQLSALVTLVGFHRGNCDTAIAPWGASCQSILFAYAEAEKPEPRAVIGFFDISQRHRVDRDILSITVPYRLFLELESNIDESFFRTEVWQQLRARQ